MDNSCKENSEEQEEASGSEVEVAIQQPGIHDRDIGRVSDVAVDQQRKDEQEEVEEVEQEDEDEDDVLARMVGSKARNGGVSIEYDEEGHEAEDEDEDAILARMVGGSHRGGGARSDSDDADGEGEEEGNVLAGRISEQPSFEGNRGEEDGSKEPEKGKEENVNSGDMEGERSDWRAADEITAEADDAEAAARRCEEDKMLAEMMANSCKPSSGWTPGKQQEDGGSGTKGKGKSKGKAKKGRPGSAPPELVCSVCGSAFDSRNQLFKHISTTGHAAHKR